MVLNECIDGGDDVIQCIDYDMNINCNRYVPEQLTCHKNKNYSFFHLNIRSLSKHYDNLVTLLTYAGCSIDVIGCSETWLNQRSYTDILNLDGYKQFIKDRSGRPGSGVCLYISSTHHVSVIILS